MQNDTADNQCVSESGADQKTTLVSRNITIINRRTSVRLEPEMWAAIQEIARRENCTIHDICTLISVRKKENTSLTAAIRVFLMLYFRAATTEDGHCRAGHGDFESMKRRACIPSQIVSLFSKRRKTNSATGLDGPDLDYQEREPGNTYQSLDVAAKGDEFITA